MLVLAGHPFLSFPNTGGRSFSAAAVSAIFHGPKALEKSGSEKFIFLSLYINFVIPVKKNVGSSICCGL
jgi:hypothetical protein